MPFQPGYNGYYQTQNTNQTVVLFNAADGVDALGTGLGYIDGVAKIKIFNQSDGGTEPFQVVVDPVHTYNVTDGTNSPHAQAGSGVLLPAGTSCQFTARSGPNHGQGLIIKVSVTVPQASGRLRWITMQR